MFQNVWPRVLFTPDSRYTRHQKDTDEKKPDRWLFPGFSITYWTPVFCSLEVFIFMMGAESYNTVTAENSFLTTKSNSTILDMGFSPTY